MTLLRRVYPGFYQTRRTVQVDGMPIQAILSVSRQNGLWTAQVQDSDGGVRISANTSSKAEALLYVKSWLAQLPWTTWSDGTWATE